MAPYRDKDEIGRPLQGQQWRPSLRMRKNRRGFVVLAALTFIAYLIYHSSLWHSTLSAEDVKINRYEDPLPSSDIAIAREAVLRKKSHPKLKDTEDAFTTLHTYNGPIMFPELYATFAGISQMPYRYRNRHVLFMAASVTAASSLAGIACDMASTKRNIVHFILFGRNEVPIPF